MTQAKVLIVGANGQLACELIKTAPESRQLTTLNKSELNVADQSAVLEWVNHNSPDWIVNASAYTAVDKAEKEIDLAYRVNRDGAKNLALAARQTGAKLIHISTDFVFDGTKGSPYLLDDLPQPQSVYGASKQAGDEAIFSILTDDSLIIRTAWVYSSHGQNFVKTMLRLMSERNKLSIVADQIGTPTWAYGLAQMIWQSMDIQLTGMQHWTDAGVASWYDFAVAIYEEAKISNLLPGKCQCTILPIRTQDFPTAAKRPAYSVLDKTSTWNSLSIQPYHWRMALREMLKEIDLTTCH